MNINDINQGRIFYRNTVEYGSPQSNEIEIDMSRLYLGRLFTRKAKSLTKLLWLLSYQIGGYEESKIQGLFVSRHQDEYFISLNSRISVDIFKRVEEAIKKVNGMGIQEIRSYFGSFIVENPFVESSNWRHSKMIEELMLIKRSSNEDMIVNYSEIENGMLDLYLSLKVPWKDFYTNCA